MRFAAKPNFRGSIKFRLWSRVNVVNPGVMEESFVGGSKVIREEHQGAAGRAESIFSMVSTHWLEPTLELGVLVWWSWECPPVSPRSRW